MVHTFQVADGAHMINVMFRDNCIMMKWDQWKGYWSNMYCLCSQFGSGGYSACNLELFITIWEMFVFCTKYCFRLKYSLLYIWIPVHSE